MKELHLLTIWKAKLKSMTVELTEPAFPSLAGYLCAIITADVGVNMLILEAPVAEKSSSDKEVLVVLPVVMSTMAQYEEKMARIEEDCDEGGEKGQE